MTTTTTTAPSLHLCEHYFALVFCRFHGSVSILTTKILILGSQAWAIRTSKEWVGPGYMGYCKNINCESKKNSQSTKNLNYENNQGTV